MYQIIEFLFFFVLLLCIEKIVMQFVGTKYLTVRIKCLLFANSPSILAFTFHRAAFQDRLDEVNKALKVFDHLKVRIQIRISLSLNCQFHKLISSTLKSQKDYRPKRRAPGTPRGLKSGRLTPTFGLRSGMKTPLYSGSRPGTPDLSHLEEGFAADTEDLDYFDSAARRERRAKKRSWLNFGSNEMESDVNSKARSGAKRRSRDGNMSESIPMSPSKRVPGDMTGGSGSANASAGPSRTGSQDFDHAVQRAAAQRGATPVGTDYGHGINSTQAPAQAHTYPPSASPPDAGGSGRPTSMSTEAEDGQMLTQAAKALKAAVLHDARNIKGKDTTEADVSFTITSPHEAKVNACGIESSKSRIN